MISVVIPVYNGEGHLANAVKSLQDETYGDWEAVIVDDGSTDGTLRIAENLASEDSRIRVIHQENGGVSSARNRGMDSSRGDWIAWLDADDAYIPNAMETIARLAKANPDCNCLQFPYNEMLPGGGFEARIPKPYREAGGMTHTGKDAFAALYAQKGQAGLHWQPWRFVFRRDSLPRFRESVIHEDLDALPLFMYSLGKVYISKEPLYIYRPAREGAATAAFSPKRVKDIIDVTGNICSRVAELKMDRSVENAFKSTLALNLFGFYLAAPGFSEPERSESLALFAKHRDWLLAIAEPPKTAWIKRLAIRILGVRKAASLLRRLSARNGMHRLDSEDI